jgi:hypothetical protein
MAGHWQEEKRMRVLCYVISAAAFAIFLFLLIRSFLMVRIG